MEGGAYPSFLAMCSDGSSCETFGGGLLEGLGCFRLGLLSRRYLGSGCLRLGRGGCRSGVLENPGQISHLCGITLARTGQPNDTGVAALAILHSGRDIIKEFVHDVVLVAPVGTKSLAVHTLGFREKFPLRCTQARSR